MICIVENLDFSDSRLRLVIVLTAGLQLSFDVAEIAFCRRLIRYNQLSLRHPRMLAVSRETLRRWYAAVVDYAMLEKFYGKIRVNAAGWNSKSGNLTLS
jgi:hypothetical protein